MESKDEFAELARVFNTIAEELETSHAQGSDAEKSVGVKVRARTQELEETMNALEQKVKNRTIELERLMSETTRMSEDIKNKETEINQLRRELSGFTQKLGKTGKSKQKTTSPETM